MALLRVLYLLTALMLVNVAAFNFNGNSQTQPYFGFHEHGISAQRKTTGASLFSSSLLHSSSKSLSLQRQILLQSASSETISGAISTVPLESMQNQMSSSSVAEVEQSVEGQRKIPYGLHMKLGKKKRILNVIGFLFCFNTMFVCTLMFPFVVLTFLLSKIIGDNKKRIMVDYCVHYWAKLSMLSMFYNPQIQGAENLPPDEDEGVLYLCNHTSFLDILTLSGFLPRVFKYVSKVEVLRIPLIGWAMQLAGHIAVKRTSRKSQLKTVRDTIASLQNGNSICMFPEGTRTKTGRIGKFKKGPFTIAKKAGVRVVPISLCNVTKWFPSFAVMPLGRPSDVVVKIHPPIDPKDMSEKELMDKTFAAIEEGLPSFQRQLTAASEEYVTNFKESNKGSEDGTREI